MSTSHIKPRSRLQKQFNQETLDLCNSNHAARKKLDNSDSFSNCACRSSNQVFCQNFCGSFPISLLRIHLRFWWLIFCFVCFLFVLDFSYCCFWVFFLEGVGCHFWFGLGFLPQGWHGCFSVPVCVYTHKDFHVIICVLGPTFQRCLSHYFHLIELKWLHKGKCDPDWSCSIYTFFPGNFESGKWERKPRESWCRSMYFEKTKNTCERDTFIFRTLLLSNFSLGCCV